MSDLERSRSSMITLSFLQTMDPWLSGSALKLATCAVCSRYEQKVVEKKAEGMNLERMPNTLPTSGENIKHCCESRPGILRSSSSAAHIVDQDFFD
jgi:hypothetical protein